jgi:hypothetical protein
LYEIFAVFHALSEILIVPAQLELTDFVNVDELHPEPESLQLAVTVTLQFVHDDGE